MSRKQFDIYQRNVKRYEAGQLNKLICPRCLTETVSVRFAPVPSDQGRYSVYFWCAVCGKHDRAQYADRPPYFESNIAEDGEMKTVEIDVTEVLTPEELHSLLKEKLRFPDYYGRNWDAFWDAITGLTEMPDRLILRGWQQFEERLPREAQLMRECLEEYQNESLPECAVEYA